MVWTAYPLNDFLQALSRSISGDSLQSEECAHAKGILFHAASCAMTMGLMTTVLGLMMMLMSIEDVAYIPKMIALSLDGLFIGLFLSGVVLVPLAHRLGKSTGPSGNANPSNGNAKRQIMGLLGLGACLTMLATTMYALTRVTNTNSVTPRAIKSSLSPDLLQEQYRLKSEFEGKIQQGVLDPIVGKGNSIAFVDAELDTDVGQVLERVESGENIQPKGFMIQTGITKLAVTIIHDDSVLNTEDQRKKVRGLIIAAMRPYRMAEENVIFRPTRFRR
jgi:hypothetical protein